MSSRLPAFVLALVLLMLVWATTPALAASARTSFVVSVTVQDTCRVFLPPAKLRETFATATSAVSVNCALATPYTVSVNAEVSTSTAPGLNDDGGRIGLGDAPAKNSEASGDEGQTADAAATHARTTIVTVTY